MKKNKGGKFMKKRLASIMLVVLLLGCLPLAAQAAPTNQQKDFISRMSNGGYIVTMSGYNYYAHNSAIYRMSTSGASKTKLYSMRNPSDLMTHGGYVYFIDHSQGEGGTGNLYRFKAGASKPTKYISGVHDAVIGGDVLYYTNSSMNILRTINLKTGEKGTIFNKTMLMISNLNYMHGLLTMDVVTSGYRDAMVLLSQGNKAYTVFEGESAYSMVAHDSHVYMNLGGKLAKVKVNASNRSLTLDSYVVSNPGIFIISGNNLYNQTLSGSKVVITRYNLNTGKSSQYKTYDFSKYGWVSLQPAGDYMWVFYHADETGAKFLERLAK